MTQFNSQTEKELVENKKSNRLTKFQWIASAVLFIVAARLLTNGDFLSTLMLLLGGLLLLPPLTDFLHSKVPFLKNKWIKGILILVLISIGMDNSSEQKAKELAEIRLEQQKKEIKTRVKFLTDYINEGTDKSIKNIAKLQEIGSLFGNASNPDDFDLSEKKYDSITKRSIWIFNPKYNFKNAEKYLFADKEKGMIEDYINP